jgi:hypothetical protein
MNKYLKVSAIVLLISLLTFILLKKYSIEEVELLGNWTSGGKKGDGGVAIVSSLELYSDGTFSAKNLPMSSRGRIWEGDGFWKFCNGNTPRPNLKPMIHLTNKSFDTSHNLDCWVIVYSYFYGNRLVWNYEMNPVTGITYQKL